MTRQKHRAAALGAAALSLVLLVSPAPGARPSPEGGPRNDPPVSTNLHRARVLFEGNARAIWVGDSWSTLQSTSRLPYGSLMVWPIGDLGALSATFRTGAMGEATDFTSGGGRQVYVDHARLWTVEYDDASGQQHFALPVFDMTKVVGRDTLTLDPSWADMPRIQAHTVRNNRIALGDLPEFSGRDDRIGYRLLYYAPLTQSNLLSHVRLADRDGTRFGAFDLRTHARPLWHLGETPGVDGPRAPIASQINGGGHRCPAQRRLPAGAGCHGRAGPGPPADRCRHLLGERWGGLLPHRSAGRPGPGVLPQRAGDGLVVVRGDGRRHTEHRRQELLRRATAALARCHHARP